MSLPDQVANLLEDCRARVNQEYPLEYLASYNEPAKLEISFNGKLSQAEESFALLAPQGEDGNYLLHRWYEAKARIPTEELPALYGILSMQKERNSDPVDLAETIELVFAQSEVSDCRKLLQRLTAYGNFREAIPETNIEALLSLMQTTMENHPYTAGHVFRVMQVGMAFMDHMVNNYGKLPFTREDFINARDAFLGHDFGKTAVEESVLNADRPLTADERAKMNQHPEASARMLSNVLAFKDEVVIVPQHHERWDGQGYPKGLAGEEIHYIARIMNIVDSFDAMTSGRSYQKHHRTDKEAADIILDEAGKQFDPHFARMFDEFMSSWGYDADRVLEANEKKWLDLDKYDFEIHTRSRKSSIPPSHFPAAVSNL